MVLTLLISMDEWYSRLKVFNVQLSGHQTLLFIFRYYSARVKRIGSIISTCLSFPIHLSFFLSVWFSLPHFPFSWFKLSSYSPTLFPFYSLTFSLFLQIFLFSPLLIFSSFPRSLLEITPSPLITPTSSHFLSLNYSFTSHFHDLFISSPLPSHFLSSTPLNPSLPSFLFFLFFLFFTHLFSLFSIM